MTPPVKTSLTPDDLNTLTKAFEVLSRLGDQTAMPNPSPDSDLPLWECRVDQAHHSLAMILIKFAKQRWVGTEPWDWPEDNRSSSISSLLKKLANEHGRITDA